MLHRVFVKKIKISYFFKSIFMNEKNNKRPSYGKLLKFLSTTWFCCCNIHMPLLFFQFQIYSRSKTFSNYFEPIQSSTRLSSSKTHSTRNRIMSLNFHITYHRTIERFSFEHDQLSQLLKLPRQRSKHKHANTHTNTQKHSKTFYTTF